MNFLPPFVKDVMYVLAALYSAEFVCCFQLGCSWGLGDVGFECSFCFVLFVVVVVVFPLLSFLISISFSFYMFLLFFSCPCVRVRFTASYLLTSFFSSLFNHVYFQLSFLSFVFQPFCILWQFCLSVCLSVSPFSLSRSFSLSLSVCLSVSL